METVAYDMDAAAHSGVRLFARVEERSKEMGNKERPVSGEQGRWGNKNVEGGFLGLRSWGHGGMPIHI